MISGSGGGGVVVCLWRIQNGDRHAAAFPRVVSTLTVSAQGFRHGCHSKKQGETRKVLWVTWSLDMVSYLCNRVLKSGTWDCFRARKG